MPLVEQTYFNIASSIIVNSFNTLAVDYSSPLILTDWLKYYNQTNSDILSQYSQYLIKWFQVKGISQNQQSTLTTNLYIDLFKSISVNYSTTEEQRFLSNVDYTDTQQILAVLPFFTKKIKQICLYYTWLRENVKTNTVQNSLRGSELGVQNIIYNEIISSLYDTDIQNLLNQNNIDVNSIRNNIAIEVEPLYDTTNYYDVSSNSYDPAIFYNFNQAVSNEINAYPTYIDGLSSLFSISLESNNLDLSLLKDKDFINTFNNLDLSNLNLNTLVKLVPEYVGTDFYYLSTDSTGTNYVSGLLFNSSNKTQNILNKRFPTTALSPLTSNLFTKKQLGGFFTPEKTGIVNFYSFNISYKTNNLKPNTVYTFPDPNKYGNISNLTQISYDSPFIFTDDISFAKISNTNTAQWGSIISDPQLKTFYPYSSRSENLQLDLENLEKYDDPEDFFNGLQDSQWANADVFPITQQGKFPIDSRYQNLLINNSLTLVQYKTDIYGNEYGLFKKVKHQVNPSDILGSIPTTTCLQLNGGHFDTPTYSLVLSSISFTQTQPAAYIISPFFYPANICDSKLSINITQYSGGTFNSNLVYSTVWQGGLFISPANNLIYNSGKFTVNGIDTELLGNLTTINTGILSADLTTQTQVVSVVDNILSQDIDLYNERQNTFGNIILRYAGNSLVSPLSTSFANIFANINSTIVADITYNLKNFDIIYNTIIFETTNYTTFLQYTYNNSQFNLASNSVQFIQVLSAFEKISNPWYSETSNTFLIAKIKTTTDLNNNQLVYPEIYQYSNQVLNLIYPLQPLSFNQLSAFSVYASTQYLINFSSIEQPSLSYNSSLNQYLISFIAHDSSNMFYVFNYTFELNNQISNMTVQFYKPQGFCHSETFNTGGASSILSLFTFPNYSSNITLTGGFLTFR